ncbi:Estradiol 17-beta-dehydrogenase 12 [Strongyloides ratti]|uniref:Estradiol 17-beta-dehydrogenase 12 n=1 Tax=Strongyloides ratti TaxID=34506 RepID=A0A090MXJ1_STRRB|nr:Estradiol 17-beta-dehydrogenase 12 [Strongyloides ratti]CEF65524.1 Estradiol 17-beta-dehydrogenase 12 [Strongyloides ratti]
MLCPCTLKIFGYGALGFILLKFFFILKRLFYPFFIASPISLIKKAGARWAVVTGSTDGIGKAYAIQLAKKGFNIVLISRNPTKLQDVKHEIEKISQDIEIKTIAYDFTNASLNDYEKIILSELKSLEVGILINNVGLSYEYPDILHKIDGGLQRITDITVINTLPPTLLTAAILPQMVERKSGIIVNVASFAGFHQMPMWAVYSATKKYVNFLTEILQKEYSNTGICFQALNPMMVATNMSKVKKTSFFTPSPSQYVKSALNTIGNASSTTGTFAHQLQAEILGLLPEFVLDYIFWSTSKVTRSKALKKKERLAAEGKKD